MEEGGGGKMYRGILLQQLKINWTMDSSHAAEWHRHVLYIGNEWHIQSQGVMATGRKFTHNDSRSLTTGAYTRGN